MKQHKLYNSLINAYSNNNLNRITCKLIELYKHGDFDQIRKIADCLSCLNSIDEVKNGRIFSRLISLYHPDKGKYIRDSINKSFHENDTDTLISYSHILLLENLDNYSDPIINNIDSIFEAEYVWDNSQNVGFSFYKDVDEDTLDPYSETDNEYEINFYDAVKLRIYGNTDVEFPYYYLEDFEDFELSSCGIVSLEGIQYCCHAISLDLSDNEISNIEEIRDLVKLEVINLSNNNIGFIDALGNLSDLKTIDISGNNIDELSPLFTLDKLEFINLINNPVSAEQVELLKNKNILVIS
jgi:Leucine-rich repeat (LRR) protein